MLLLLLLPNTTRKNTYQSTPRADFFFSGAPTPSAVELLSGDRRLYPAAESNPTAVQREPARNDDCNLARRGNLQQRELDLHAYRARGKQQRP